MAWVLAHQPSLRRALVWFSFFLIIVGARLCVVAQFGSSLPLMDQWDAEGAALYKPWLNGTLRARDLLVPHTESRMLPSNVLALTLLALNGQWDGRVQMVVNTFICASMAVAVAAAAIRLLGNAQRTPVLVGVACLFAFPYGWENTTWGFQSSFYFLVFFSVIAIWALVLHRAWSARWWMGVAAAVLACVSMASGLLAAAAVLAQELLRLLTGRKSLRESYPTIALSTVITTTAALLRTDVPEHAVFKARSLGDWFHVVAHYLSWPWPGSFNGLLIYLPLGLLLLVYLQRRRATAARDEVVATEVLLAIGAWAILQAGGIGYARGGQSGDYVPSRYADIFAFGTLANFFAVLLLLQQHAGPERWRKAAALGATVWITGAALGMAFRSHDGVEMARGKTDQARELEHAVRTYLATGDPQDSPPDRSIFSSVWRGRFAEYLNDAQLRSILPASVRPAVTLDAAPDPPATASSRSATGSWHLGPANTWDSKPPESGGVLQSQLIAPTLPVWRFEIDGVLGKRMSLQIRSETNGQQVRLIPPRRKREMSRTAYIALPPGDVRIVARDENSDGWFAFRGPVEMGRLSFYAERLLRVAPLILASGIILLLGIGMYQHVVRVTYFR